jgi:hypothetical protein
MPTARSLIAGLALAFTAISCTDKGPTAPTNSTANQTPTASAKPNRAKQPLVFPVSPGQTFLADGTGSAAAGTPFTVGYVQITHFAYENGQLFADGGLFDASGAQLGTFSHIPATLTSSGAPTQPSCQVLTLDLGPLHLDLLGLVVDLAPVHLNITAQSGPGNLLGNLLCAVTHLLDQGSPLQNAITNLLNTINNLLSGLLGSI